MTTHLRSAIHPSVDQPPPWSPVHSLPALTSSPTPRFAARRSVGGPHYRSPPTVTLATAPSTPHRPPASQSETQSVSRAVTLSRPASPSTARYPADCSLHARVSAPPVATDLSPLRHHSLLPPVTRSSCRAPHASTDQPAHPRVGQPRLSPRAVGRTARRRPGRYGPQPSSIRSTVLALHPL